MKAKRLTKWTKKHTNNIARIMVIVVFLFLAVWAITLENNSLVLGYSKSAIWFTTALKSVGPELAGIVIGVVTIDYFNEKRQDTQIKRQFILRMASSHNDVTDTAIRTLRAYGWLYDGSLKNAILWGANLEKADLWKANLEKADLRKANLKKAILWKVNLKEANLSFANLNGATHWTEEQLLKAETLEGAIMPDGRKYEEWILDKENQVDQLALNELDKIIKSSSEEE